ncbi:MAG: hypothetical protein ABIS27_13525 [Longimicrobiales bacterium]
MNTFTLLMLLSVIAASALFIALAVFLVKISNVLEWVGGKTRIYGEQASFLSKIRLGVRAIEVQTGALAPQVTTLNAGLSGVRDGMRAIDANLDGVIAAVVRQGEK